MKKSHSKAGSICIPQLNWVSSYDSSGHAGKIEIYSVGEFYCYRPSLLEIDSPVLDGYRYIEKHYLKKGLQLWIIVFLNNDSKVTFNNGLLLTDKSQISPTAEQLHSFYENCSYLRGVAEQIHKACESGEYP